MSTAGETPVTVIDFPKAETRDQRIRGIEVCLSYLQTEARSLGLPMLAHIIGVAREEAREARPAAANTP